MFNADLIIGFSSLAFAALVYFVTRGLSTLGIIFINYTLIATVVLSVYEIFIGFYKPERIKFFDSIEEQRNIISGLIILTIYLIFLPLIGFLPSSYAFYFAFNLFLSEDRWNKKTLVQSIILSFIVVTMFYIIFNRVLSVPLPKASLF